MKRYFSNLFPILILALILFGLQNVPAKSGLNQEKVEGATTLTEEEFMSAAAQSESSPDQSVLLNENRPARFRTAEAKKMKSALPQDNSFLRDFTVLSNGRGYLVLYVDTPYLIDFPGFDENGDGVIETLDWNCPNQYYGQQLEGEYYLGVVRDSKLINAVPLPKSEYEPNRPVFRQFRGIVEETWEDEPTVYDLEIIEPPLLNLKDLNGDGSADEVSFRAGYEACGHNEYAIGGYDRKTDKVVFYEIRDNDISRFIYDNFYPSPDGSVLYNSGCYHLAGAETLSRYLFNQKEQAYILQSSKEIECLYDKP